MLSEQAEEVLEALWVNTEERGNKPLELGASRDDPAIDELVRLGYIRKDAGHIYLLENGKSHAAGCVRRHRLAERLLTDVFDIKKKIIDEVSCKFEHLLHEGLEDKVCGILGHPRLCPHGKTIPPGKCCLERDKKQFVKFISSLARLDVKDKGHVAYLQAKDKEQMQKLISVGVLPGMPIALQQKFPSYVISLGHAQFAIDKELAASIYVRLSR